MPLRVSGCVHTAKFLRPRGAPTGVYDRAMRTVFFLAAGLGTRLRPLTDEVPKALVPIGNRPQLLRLAQRFADLHQVVNAHHHAEQILAAAARAGITVSSEREVLGTAGGLRQAWPLFRDGAIWVHNADIEVDPQVVRRAFAHTDAEALATLLVGEAQPPGQGAVGLDAERRIVRLRDVSVSAEVSSASYLGVAELAARTREHLPERGCLVGEVWIPRLRAGDRLCACDAASAQRASTSFFDLGTPASYLAANLRWLEDADLLVRAERGARVDPAARWIVAGEGALVEAPAERVVVWPGARVTEPLHDAIVTRAHVVKI